MALACAAVLVLLTEGAARLAGAASPCAAAPCVEEAGHRVSGHRYLHEGLLGGTGS